MGFSAVPPKPDFAIALRAIDMWTGRADAGIISFELPWTKLLSGTTPESDVLNDKLPLANRFRSKGLDVVVMIDVENGVARERESAELVAAGRSITEPAIQAIYRRYVVLTDSVLKPSVLGLALETNLVRLAAPAGVYEAAVKMTNDAARELRARGSTAKLAVSLQVEVAWGRLGGNGPYRGVAADMRDFPFVDVLGLSSYPYLGLFNDPSEIPDNYYSRIATETGRRVFVSEGGWSSAPISLPGISVASSPAMQARNIARQAVLLNTAHAFAFLQLEFADLDIGSFPPPVDPGILPFLTIGIVDSELRAKPGLASWDSVFARRYVP
ncbi:MAG TPA: hypothetical protein VHE78_00535 [Gemmatimonadaceae bacterium]|nr:hypothetical protein [Gemmatimonadaceae bacterium]